MIKYDLHLLGWHAFQQLCLTVTRELLGQTVVSFLDTNDAGKDGAFAGKWKIRDSEDLHGKFVIQCKFTNRVDHNLTISQLAEEFDKVEKLVTAGECDSYILMTNAGISGRFDSAFNKKMRELGVKAWRPFGGKWICDQIQENKRLRMLVPRVYGLGDLSQILDERAYAQARQLLASMRDDLSKIVITSAYNKAAKALSEHGFVLIIGEPAAGKTTIASLLAMAAVDQWEDFTLKLDRPSQVTKHWNPDDPNQFMWIDDAFGVTQYESDLVSGWNHILMQVKSMLRQGVKIVMTSRNYIYRRARADLKDSAFPLFNESQVVIDVHELKTTEKEQILYNHIRLGRQPKSFISELKPFLGNIVNHPRFIPETARRLADPAFTKNLHLWPYALMDFVDKQESFLEDVLKGLDRHSKGALALIYMNNGQLPSPLILNDQEQEAIARLGSDVGNCIEALDAMKDSLVQYTFIDDNALWRFKHPTIADAYAALLAKSPEQLEIYLHGTAIDKVRDQVTCGEVGLEKAIAVPKGMFPMMLERLKELRMSGAFKTAYLSSWDAKRLTLNFLSRRSSKEFLRLYLKHNPDIFEKIIKPNLTFRFSEEIRLVIKLYEDGLLPDEQRKQFVEYIGHFTKSGEDMELFNNAELQAVFTEAELADVVDHVKKELIPKLGALRETHEAEFRKHNKDTSEEHMEDFIDRMNILHEHFGEEETIVKIVEKEIKNAKYWVSSNDDEEESETPERVLDSSEEATPHATSRSIFDDIDEI